MEEFSVGQSELGSLSVNAQMLNELATCRLPEGVTCLSIRFRSHDGVALVLLSDRRTRWNRSQDEQTARQILDDFKKIGVQRPRVQWVRATPEVELRELKLRRSAVTTRPLFWAFVSMILASVVLMTWKRALVSVGFGLVMWKISHWFLYEEGWVQLKKLRKIRQREGKE